MAVLSGTIIDAAGRPIAGATIRVADLVTGALVSLTEVGSGDPLANPLTTDALGAYEATIAEGDYLLTVTKGSATTTQAVTIGSGGSTVVTLYTITYGPTVAIDYTNGQHQKITLTGNWTPSAITGMAEGDELILIIIQDGTGGHVADLAALVEWQDKTEPGYSTAANAVDTVVIRKINGVLMAVHGPDWGTAP